MSGYERCPECPHPLVGTRWSINDSGTVFEVMTAGDVVASVRNISGPPRPRYIKVKSLRTTKSKTGYTQVGAAS